MEGVDPHGRREEVRLVRLLEASGRLTLSSSRTVFLVLIASQHSNTPSELRLEDVDLPLPCHEDIWDARNEVEWLQKMASRRTQPPKLSDALFRPRPTDGTADDDDWMGSFALTVLTAAVSAAVRAGWTATEAEPAVV